MRESRDERQEAEDGENIVSRNLPLVFKVAGKSWVNNHAHVLKPQKLTKLLKPKFRH
jgi:hypothetical protein